MDTLNMRKSIIELAVLLLAISAASAQPVATDFGVNDISGDPNTFVLVPVNITNVQNESIAGIMFDISFDPSAINLTKDRVQKGELTSAWDYPRFNPANGRISIVFGHSGTEIPTGKSGSVVILNFSVVGAPGAKSAMNISRIQLSDLEGALGTASANNGTFIISQPSSQPSISFTNPTPANSAILAQNYVYIKTTVSHASTAFIDWNRSLVGWWRFNSESGEKTTFFRDWSSWRNNATCSGTNCPASTSGKFGKALDFDGVNDYVDAGNKTSLNITGNITVEAWIKPERLETAYLVKRATRDSTDGYELSLSKATGKAYFRVNQKTSGNTYKLFSTSKYPVDGNTWVHLVGVYNRGQLQIYFNGKLENSMSGPTKILSNTDNLKIGGTDDSRYFKGTIDEVRIWKRALRPEEIKASYDVGRYRLYRNFTNLANGVYNYKAYTQNLQGNVKQTGKRTLTLIAQQ